MAGDPTYVLTYDGADYPVTFGDAPAFQAGRYEVDFSTLATDDPFAAGYDNSGFTINEYVDGAVTATLVFDANQPVPPVGPGYPVGNGTVFYTFHGYATVSPGFDGYVPCFAHGTAIATPTGPIAVQDLTPGTEVTTTAGPGRVVWLGHRRAHDADIIRIRRGTLGAVRDLIVSEDHALFLDGVLVPAGLLVDGVGIVRERIEAVTLYHVELERHAILLAEGVEAESYIDTGNRRQFGNCPIAYDPVQATKKHCAELVLAGARLDAIRSRLVPA